MRKTLVASTALALIGYVGAAAEAGELLQGPYLSAFGGVNWLEDVNDEKFCDTGGSCDEYDAEFDRGFVVGGALGYRTGRIGPGHVRGEVEVAYRRNGVDGVFFFESVDSGPNCVDGGCTLFDDMTALSGMVNLWYDVPVGNGWSLFAGAGIGAAKLSLHDIGTAFFEASSLEDKVDKRDAANDSDVVFAYQFGAGVTRTLPSGVELTAEYRYFGTADSTFDGTDFSESVSIEANRVHAEYQAHSAMFGLRVPLNPPAGQLPMAGGAANDVAAGRLPQGIYLSAFGGANWLADTDDEKFCDSSDSCDPYDAEFDLDFVVGGALGYRTERVGPGHIRGEVEAAYRLNGVDDVFFFESSCEVTGCELFDDMTSLSLMANLWYDVPVGNGWSLFAGGGAGAAKLSLHDIGSIFFESADSGDVADPTDKAVDSDIVFAYQAGAGVSYTLPIGAELTAEYRYFATADPEFETIDAFESNGGIVFDIDHVHSAYQSHSAMVGLRIPLN